MIEAVASPIDPIPRVVHGFDGNTPTEEQISTIGEIVVPVVEVSLEPPLLESPMDQPDWEEVQNGTRKGSILIIGPDGSQYTKRKGSSLCRCVRRCGGQVRKEGLLQYSVHTPHATECLDITSAAKTARLNRKINAEAKQQVLQQPTVSSKKIVQALLLAEIEQNPHVRLPKPDRLIRNAQRAAAGVRHKHPTSLDQDLQVFFKLLFFYDTFLFSTNFFYSLGGGPATGFFAC